MKNVAPQAGDPSLELPDWDIGASTRGGGVLRRLLRLRLYYKVLIANGAIVVVVALAFAMLAGVAEAGRIAIFVAASGVLLTIALNALVLWLALSPLAQLEATAARVQAGDLDARAPVSPLADRNLRRLARTFNAMLDADAEHRRRLRAIAVSALGAAEEERRRIARELHDGAAQELAALNVGLRVARGVADPAQRDQMLLALGEELARQMEQLRELAGGLRPPALDMLGLGPALESYARQLGERTGLRVCASVNGGLSDALSDEAQLALYRMVQEALGNVMKHADAAQVDVALWRENGAVIATVQDDGRGFDVAQALAGGSVGLFGLQERAAYIGGRVDIDSVPGRGTLVRIEIPVREAAGT
jgi:two-component system, NarL family, sensor histidine kinase UhpB